MRHVDDAHDAEGDGKADRREQQHRAERDAVPDVLAGRPDRQRAVDAGDRRRQPRPSARLRRMASNEVSSDSASRSPRAAEHLDRRELVGLGQVGDQHGRGARLLEPRLDAGVGLLGDRRIERRECAAGSGLRNMFSAAASRTAGSGEPSVSVPSTSRMTRAQPVVDLDLGHLGLGGLAGRLRRSAGRAG